MAASFLAHAHVLAFAAIVAFRRAPKRNPFGEDMRCVLRATPSTRSCPGLTLNPQLEVEKAEVGQGSEAPRCGGDDRRRRIAVHPLRGHHLLPVNSPSRSHSARADNFACTDVHRTDPESEKTDLKRSIATHGGTLIEKIPDPDKHRIVVSSAFSGE
jgi:hypothetical protein